MALLTTKELIGALVAELGDAYRYTPSRISQLVTRDEHPMPVAEQGGPNRSHKFDLDDVLDWLEQEAARQDARQEPVVSVAGGVQLTITAVSRELDTHNQTLARRLADWNVQPVQRRGGVDYYRLRDILEALTASSAAEDPEMLPAQERRAHYQAEQLRDSLRVSRRELIEVDEARGLLGQLMAVRADFYDLLTDRLEQKAQLAPEALSLVESEIDAVRSAEAAAVEALHAKLTAESLQ